MNYFSAFIGSEGANNGSDWMWGTERIAPSALDGKVGVGGMGGYYELSFWKWCVFREWSSIHTKMGN